MQVHGAVAPNNLYGITVACKQIRQFIRAYSPINRWDRQFLAIQMQNGQHRPGVAGFR